MSEATLSPHDGTEGPEGSLRFILTSPLSVGQFSQELNSGASGEEDMYTLLVEGSAAEASPDNPVTLWVSPPSEDAMNPLFVEEKVRDHVVDPDWAYAPSSWTIETVISKVHEGALLSPEEITIALRHLLFPSQEG